VLLADRHPGLSEGVRGLLETVFSTVFLVRDEASLTEGARRLSPGLIVADLSLAPGNAAGFVRRLCGQVGGAKVLVLSAYDEPTVAQAVIGAGADGVVLERAIATDLLAAIESLMRGIPYISPAMLGPVGRSVGAATGCP
jgi:DNA-binding NarL/FixJ family response regulator